MTTTAPAYQPLIINIGADFEIQVPFTDQATGDPIPVASPKMQIRAGIYPSAPLIVTPTVTASGNTVTVALSGTDSLTVTSVFRGAYDLFATRTDTGAEVKLLYGPVTFVANVTTLP